MELQILINHNIWRGKGREVSSIRMPSLNGKEALRGRKATGQDKIPIFSQTMEELIQDNSLPHFISASAINRLCVLKLPIWTSKNMNYLCKMILF